MSMDLATRAAISIDMLPLERSLEPALEQVVVDDHLHLPDMFAITLRDPDGDALQRSRVRIGSTVRISGAGVGQRTESPIIHGEVTALEAHYGPNGARVVVRGYDHSHRLSGGARTEVYRDVTDTDVARTIATRAGIQPGQMDDAGVSHAYILQSNQSDLEFLYERAREVGFDVAVIEGRLDFRRPPEASEAPREGDYASSDPLQLVLGTNLLEFHPRITAASQVREVEVRGWDPAAKDVVVGQARAQTTAAEVSERPDGLAQAVGRDRIVAPGRPVGDQQAIDAEAAAIAERIASSHAEAEGVARGHPALKAGVAVSVSGVGDPFNGRYMLTRTRHVFDDQGYRTELYISGRQDRSLLGLTSARSSREGAGQLMRGLAVAIVTDNADPEDLGRVKVRFPTLDEQHESDWVRVAQLGAGPDSGFVVLPEVNDEVIVGFESGDIRRPYVLGGLWNGQDRPPLGDGLFSDGRVLRRGFVSRAGHRLVFFDDDSRSGIGLVSADDSIRIGMRQSDSELTINSDGSATITAGQISIEASGDLSIRASGSLALEGSGGVTIESGGTVDIDGAIIQLN